MAKFLMIPVLVLLCSMATLTYAQTTCAQKLVSCSPYLNNATAIPRDDCCDPIREAVANELPCLCNLYNDPNLLAALNVTVPEALRVSRECGTTTDLDACNTTSPTSAPIPPGQSGGAIRNRIALAGVTTLFLFLVTFVYSSGL